MKKAFQTALLLCCLTLFCQGALAINEAIFTETFSGNNGTGGKDGKFDGTIASSNAQFDNDGWTIALVGDKKKVYGAYNCVRFGDTSNNGSCTTPSIAPGTTYVLLTFSAAGWGDDKTNKLTVTATDGIGLTGDTSIDLENEEWLDYNVLINTNGVSNFNITFSGKRGFLDDVVVRNIDVVEAPVLPASCNFWPNTTEAATKTITIEPANFTTIRYTTDGTTPTTSAGTLVTASTNVVLSTTTTIKAIAYIGSVTSEMTNRTYTLGTTNVNSISAFNDLAEGVEARLFLSTNQNARVLHGQDGQMYLRDNTGTLCVDFGLTATFNPTPTHNQHVAGWIVGQKQTVNGLPKLVATTNSNTNHLALAAPVLEPATAPKAIALDAINSNIGDWVTMENVRNGNPITVSGIYNNALTDVSGIITANNTISPVDYADIKPVIYVIDEDEVFTLPDADITEATVRLKRTLKKDYWNTFAIPMNLPITGEMAGKYYKYSSVNDEVMVFSEANSIEAGVPYLVKPNEDIVNKIFTNVTLTNTPAGSIVLSGSNNAFVATYSPTELATDKTEQFLTASGKLGYPGGGSVTTLKGMRAFFRIPSGSSARLVVDGEDVTEINQVRYLYENTGDNFYNLNGQRVSLPTAKGLYIMNGKKVVVK